MSEARIRSKLSSGKGSEAASAQMRGDAEGFCLSIGKEKSRPMTRAAPVRAREGNHRPDPVPRSRAFVAVIDASSASSTVCSASMSGLCAWGGYDSAQRAYAGWGSRIRTGRRKKDKRRKTKDEG